MCLLIFAHQLSADYPLMVAANRDEFYARPTAPAAFWPEYPGLLAGRDLEQGGTWMGVTRQGRFAAVTNYRDPDVAMPAPRSRGELPLDYLAGNKTPASYLAELAKRSSEYAGFNLLAGDRDSLWYFANSGGQAPRALSPGLYGLSNARLDTPWPKVERGKAMLLSLQQGDGVSHDDLAQLVADRTRADPHSLACQGLNDTMDRTLSAQFIVTEGYGTRSSTTLWTESSGSIHWRELSFGEEGELSGARAEVMEPWSRSVKTRLKPPGCG